MGNANRVGDLEIDEDLDFQRKTWRLQRAAWVVMGAVVGLGLLGLFGGGGPISRATAGASGSSLRVTYDRFARRDAAATLEFLLWPGQGREARLHLDADYLDDVRIERIEPPPVREEAGPDGSTYLFALPDPSEPAGVTIHLRALGVGPLRGEARLGDGPSVGFGHFVYP